MDRGDFLVITGENGVGKTTLTRALFGQLKPRQGEIKTAPGTKFGYVPQFRNVDSEYPLSIWDFVALNLPQSWRPWLNKEEKAMVDHILAETDLTRIKDRPLGLASGGEKQRAYLAQALLNHPKLLVMDESTASLDNEMKYELLDLVQKFQEDGITVLFITHDWDLAKKYGTKFLNLVPGGYSTGPIEDLPKREGEAHV